MVGRLLDFVPGYTNGFRDSPHHLEDGKVFCRSGRILDAKSGKLIDRISPETVLGVETPKSDAKKLYDSNMNSTVGKPDVGGLLLSHPGSSKRRNEWMITAEEENGALAWEFNITQTGMHIDGNFYSYRLADAYIYLVVSEEPRYKPHPSRAQTVIQNPTRWHLLSLDVGTGKVIQQIPLGEELLAECRIEDVDADGLLIGNSSQHLAYFERLIQIGDGV